MLGSQVVILITIAVYLIAMVLIGVYFGKKAAATAAMTFTWAAARWARW